MRYFPSDLLPSAAAHCAARSRVNAARSAATARAMRRDYYYPPIIGGASYGASAGVCGAFHTFDRPRDCYHPNAGRDVRYLTEQPSC